MRIGINAGFGDPVKHEFDQLRSLGFTFVRQDLRPEFDDRKLNMLIAEFVGAGIAPLFLIGGGHIQRPDKTARIEPHELAALAGKVVRCAAECGLADYWLEFGNEPDLAHPDYAKRPQDFAEALRQCRSSVRAEGFEGLIISGGISNLNKRGLNYLNTLMDSGLPDDVVIGFHRYPDGLSPSVPHEGFSNRDAEWARLSSLAAGRPLACTEVGHHTAPRKVGRLGQKKRISDSDAASHFEFDLEYFRAKNCLLTAVYQLNDGANADEALDRYGIRTVGSTAKFKAAANTIRLFCDRNPQT